jgi:hypothetical protein
MYKCIPKLQSIDDTFLVSPGLDWWYRKHRKPTLSLPRGDNIESLHLSLLREDLAEVANTTADYRPLVNRMAQQSIKKNNLPVEQNPRRGTEISVNLLFCPSHSFRQVLGCLKLLFCSLSPQSSFLVTLFIFQLAQLGHSECRPRRKLWLVCNGVGEVSQS